MKLNLQEGQCVMCPKGVLRTIVNKTRKLCSFHNKVVASLRAQKATRSRPKRVTKRDKQNELYYSLRNDFMAKHGLCEINSPVCIRKSQCVHHTKGRIGSDLTDVSTWMPSCNPCNLYVEEHSQWAKDNGKAFSRLKTTK